nr:ataxin-7 isoform X1 [Paramormyrops kingsleyae]XP_023649738.1 ataxin-7 isoform X1 [Paramormyrops kingsleyae]XP_023649739.1 ataxin-7 isoform X1 [Paramormyrops kingsleyae]XP_023649740.1 ataxin-7 isoform X1 [Paramormyrops kingsleyae]
MSERADCDVRKEQRRAARQPKQQQRHIQQGEASTAMATVGERRSLPSPEIVLGQPWSDWLDVAKLHGNDGAESEESLKEFGKNREAMRLCRDDMPIFGQFPAQDDFFLVMCSHCGQVVKPQAFQAHYERRHSSASKPPLVPVMTYPLSGLPKTGTGMGWGGSGRPASGNGAALPPPKVVKVAKEKMPVHRGPPFPFKVLPDKTLTSAAKVEKPEPSPKLSHSSTSSATVSPPTKLSLNYPSIPKAPLSCPGPVLNGQGLYADRKQDTNRRQLHRRLPAEFNPDVHCGVLDLVARKPCTRSLTCKTHSLSQRRAVPGRRKRFDALLAEHKSRARDRELQRGSELPQQTPLLRDPHPSPARPGLEHHPAPPSAGEPKAPNPSLPRLTCGSSHTVGSSQGDPRLTQGSPHQPTCIADGVSHLSSDEGENEEREEGLEKLDCHYSGYHPRPAAYCTFDGRLFGRGCYVFGRRWDRVRSTFSTMVDKHVSSHLWKKIPPAPESSPSTMAHRTSTSSLLQSHTPYPATSLSPPLYAQSLDNKSVPSYGTALTARTPPPSAADHPAHSAPSRQVSSSPQMPSVFSTVPGRPPKPRPSSKSLRSKESLGSGCNSTGGGGGSAKKRKNSSPLPSHPPYPAEPSPSSSFKKNCAVTSGGSGSAFHPPLGYSSSSSSHSGIHSLGFNSAPSRTNSLGLKQEQPGRVPTSGSPAESIKRMSVVMNSSDSTLSLGPFVHQGASEQQTGFSHTRGVADGQPEGRKRKGPPSVGGIHGSPGRPKVAKSLSINNIHGKHGRGIPGTQGLANSSLIQQPKARP